MPVKLVPACFKPGTGIQELHGFLDTGLTVMNRGHCFTPE